MSALPLDGLRVVDAASLFAGPVIGTMLGDYGADVVKIEQPAGDNLRSLGWAKDGVSLWWALIGRNKRSVTLKLSDPAGAEVARKLLADGRRVHRELPHRHAGAVGARVGRPARDQPEARHGPHDRLRADRPVRHAAGLRDARGVDDGLRPHQRLPGRPAHAAALRARRRRRGDDRRLRRDDGALVARHAGRHRAGHRPLDLRAAVLDPRPARDRLPAARHRAGAHGQPGAVHRAAQRLSGEGRQVARRLGERPVDRRARHDARRPPRAHRGAVVRRSHRPPGAPGRARRRDLGVDRRARLRRGRPRVRGGPRGHRADPVDRRDRPRSRSSSRGTRSPRSTTPSSARCRCRTSSPGWSRRRGRIRWPGPELGSSNEAVLRDELGLTEEQIAALVEMGVVADAAPDDPRSTREERT